MGAKISRNIKFKVVIVWVQGQSDLQSQFKDSQGYVEGPCGGKKVVDTQILKHFFVCFIMLL